MLVPRPSPLQLSLKHLKLTENVLRWNTHPKMINRPMIRSFRSIAKGLPSFHLTSNRNFLYLKKDSKEKKYVHWLHFNDRTMIMSQPCEASLFTFMGDLSSSSQPTVVCQAVKGSFSNPWNAAALSSFVCISTKRFEVKSRSFDLDKREWESESKAN